MGPIFSFFSLLIRKNYSLLFRCYVPTPSWKLKRVFISQQLRSLLRLLHVEKLPAVLTGEVSGLSDRKPRLVLILFLV